jgi:hypothetical protein
LTLEDFDAFAPGPTAEHAGPGARARSGRSAAVRARLDLTPRLVRWARGVARRLEELGVAARVVTPGFGAGPRKGEAAQRVFLREEPEAVAGARRAETGVRLALRVDASGVEVALEVLAESKSVSSRSREELGAEAWRAELLSALEALPEPFVVESGPAERAAWVSLFERAIAGARSLKVCWRIPRDVALAQAGSLDVELEDAMASLVPLYKVIAHPGLDPKRSRGKVRGERSRSARLAPAAPGSEAPQTFDRGARVRVLSGAFAGKVGVVKEVEADKGYAQVMLGLLAVRIDLKDLSPYHPSARPTLSSSHRRPLGLR